MFTNRKQANEFYADVLFDADLNGCLMPVMRELCLNDLFFMLVKVLNRSDINHDWLFERCIEVQQDPNGYLDLWAREHRKSTIITYALTIQDILDDPEICVGLFSVTRPLAKDFLDQIKTEFEINQTLKDLFPDVLWQRPEREAKSWSLDNGIVLKRKGNPRENTVEAFGLVEGLPTGKHFQIRVYDDIIDEKLVTNPDIIRKVTQRWELSLNLGSDRVVKKYGVPNIERYIGTRYHFNDPYASMIKRTAATPRIHPATEDGKPEGKPIFFSKELLAEKRRKMGSYIFACQMLQNPKADEVQGFKEEDFKYWHQENWSGMNRYITVDPASAKKKESDYTVMLVWGLGEDRNYYVIDGVRDRLNLTERAKWLFKLHRTYRPINTGYEKYGMQADIEYMEEKMERNNYRFTITPLGGQMPKLDRIRRLIPKFEECRVYFPVRCIFVDYERKPKNLTKILEDEFIAFPVSEHDDATDCAARILDKELGAGFPTPSIEMPGAHIIDSVETNYELFPKRR
jgi:predicted phage terminase large subunit-like protein